MWAVWFAILFLRICFATLGVMVLLTSAGYLDEPTTEPMLLDQYPLLRFFYLAYGVALVVPYSAFQNLRAHGVAFVILAVLTAIVLIAGHFLGSTVDHWSTLLLVALNLLNLACCYNVRFLHSDATAC